MTNQIDPNLCRSHLAKMLVEEVALLTTLEAQLLREHQLLTANDAEGLDAASNERQACVGRLLKVEDERRALCRMLGRPEDLKGVEALIAWCDPEAQLLPALRQSVEHAQRCREQNVRNGVLVSARLQRVSSMLSMLNVSGGQTHVYGRAGAGTTAGPRAGHVLSASA
jgi:flagellar biosynthesis/type III secretory pathway chaperone